MDSGTYAIARWGVERAAGRGVPVRRFPHHDAGTLAALIEQDHHAGRRPVVVADGFCPTCGKPAPLAAFLRCVERDRGCLVLDDTQALAVLGREASETMPYGRGGGGSLRWQGIDSPDVIVGSSLAKGFGVPVAVLAGTRKLIHRFEQHSETLLHSSPPSLAVVRAAEQALAVNRAQGDDLRRHLAHLVRRFRARLRELGLAADGDLFPVQTLRPIRVSASTLHARLMDLGIRTVVIRCCRGLAARLALLITALHRLSDIDRAVEAVGHAIGFGRAIMPRARAS
jgi:8-amino-7-oxononanoate synthase